MPDDHPLSTLLAGWLDKLTFPAGGTTLRCGVSGGADSLAMMALGVASGCAITAVHVDHGQRPGGREEAQLVAEFAASVGAEFEAATVDVAPGSNLEARMRSARYAVLGTDAATGHTADDQAETVLINLIRGSGLVGLGAMTPGPRHPILGLCRTDTVEICRLLGWKFIEDPSNADPSFQRNRIRHEVLPLLDAVAGREVTPLLVRSAGHARDAAHDLASMAAEIDVTDARALAGAPRAAAAIAVQTWIRRETGDPHPIDAAAVGRVLAVAAGDAVAAEVTGGWRVSRSKQQLTLTEPVHRQ